jgi:YEATS domain-containing protein 4
MTASKKTTNASKSTSGASDESGLLAPRRMEHTTACLPIVYGSVAFYLGKKADEYNTHQWTLHLRGPNNEDLSPVISKVVFHLHPSFAQPTRELTEPPYEVTERGWGEFEAQVRIVWKDSSERPILISHGIKLYPPGTAPNAAPTDTETAVVAESYDEVVFTDPSETFYTQLLRVANLPPITTYTQLKHFKGLSDSEDMASLIEAQKFLHQELSAVKERMMGVDQSMQEVDAALRDIHEKQQSQKATGSRKASVSRSAPRSAPRPSAGPASKKAKTAPSSVAPTLTKS